MWDKSNAIVGGPQLTIQKDLSLFEVFLAFCERLLELILCVFRELMKGLISRWFCSHHDVLLYHRYLASIQHRQKVHVFIVSYSVLKLLFTRTLSVLLEEQRQTFARLKFLLQCFILDQEGFLF